MCRTSDHGCGLRGLKVLLNHLASHGFVVIASNSPNVQQGTPEPMLAGVTWVLEQNADPTSVMYQRIDTTHVGATGHSRGGLTPPVRCSRN
jgi:predicted dienelactone hydrolase